MEGNIRKRCCTSSALMWGLFLIAFGTIALLDQMNLINGAHVFRYFWPASFIILGGWCALFGSQRGRVWGVFFALLGGLLLLGTLGYVRVNFSIIWPLAILFWGITLVAKGFSPRVAFSVFNSDRWTDPSYSSDPTVKMESVFASSKRRVTSQVFKGGKLASVFAEIVIDLTQAQMEGSEAVLKADAVFGACVIRVPDTWEVSMEGSAVFGEFSDQTTHRAQQGGDRKKLIIKGAGVFGSVVVKN